MTNAIYSDFDGTIAKTDTVNAFFEMFADKSWIESEKMWREGRITSKENALIQVGLVRPVNEKDLNGYIDSIEIDDCFLEFYEYTRKHGIQLTILSDGFDLFIKRTLEKYGIENIRFYANHLIYQNGKFRIEFPHNVVSCKIGAGMCKCSRISDDGYCYIGDGVTDFCVAKKAKVLFASKCLDKYCNDNGIRHVTFGDFGDILDYLIRFQTTERYVRK